METVRNVGIIGVLARDLKRVPPELKTECTSEVNFYSFLPDRRTRFLYIRLTHPSVLSQLFAFFLGSST
jgi:hypothetical protein